MNFLIQRMFENRGYTTEFLREVDDASYGKLARIDDMAAKLREIHDAGSEITVFPDFDMDGIASGTEGFAGLAEMGFRVNLFVPDPDKGYGIDKSDIPALLSRFPNTKAIITCDTGITAVEAAEVCRKMGIEFLVTDHHTQPEDSKMAATCVVDPLCTDETYPHPQICGAFVFWQVLQRYADLYCNYFTQDQIRRLRVFAGIGTVSDSMPLLYENRQVVRDAVSICRFVYGDGTAGSVASINGCNTYRLAFWGLYNLMKVCESNGIIKDVHSIDEDFFGFYLAPMFNSVKRMGGNMTDAFGVFFANQSEACAHLLYDLNVKRRMMVQQEFEAVKNRSQPYAPYIYYSDAREGVLGLIATRLCNENGGPVFVMNDRGVDYKGGCRYHGSGRTPDWYDGIDRLEGVIEIAGHQHAFGWGVWNQSSLEHFYRFLTLDVPVAQGEAVIEEPKPDFVISTDWSADSGIDIDMFNGYLDEIDDYRPFGHGFPEPRAVLRFKNSDVISWRQIGRAKEHLKICLANGFDILCWGQGSMIGESTVEGWHQVTGMLSRSEYRGTMSVNFTGTLAKGVEVQDAAS